MDSRRPSISNIRIVDPTEGTAYPSNAVFFTNPVGETTENLPSKHSGK